MNSQYKKLPTINIEKILLRSAEKTSLKNQILVRHSGKKSVDVVVGEDQLRT